MNIIHKRVFKGDKYTIGHWYIHNQLVCDTLEDTDRGLTSAMSLADITAKKKYGITAIPTGTYEITLDVVSPKFKNRSWAAFCGGKLPRILNIKGFDGVLVHTGNKPEDTLGCILLGENKIKGQLINSTVTFTKVYKLLDKANKNKEKITITIQ